MIKITFRLIVLTGYFLATNPCVFSKPSAGILLSDELTLRLVGLAPELKHASFKVLKSISFDAGIESFIYLELAAEGLPHEMGHWSGPIIVKTHFNNADWSNADVYFLKRKLTSADIFLANEKSMKYILHEFGSPFP